MKKIIAMLLALVMVLSLAACGGAPAEEAPKATEAPDVEETKAKIASLEYIQNELNGIANVAK